MAKAKCVVIFRVALVYRQPDGGIKFQSIGEYPKMELAEYAAETWDWKSYPNDEIVIQSGVSTGGAWTWSDQRTVQYPKKMHVCPMCGKGADES